MTPKISIITSIYRGESYIDSFLSSVFNQTVLEEIELIVVLNEGSGIEKETLRKFEKNAGVLCNFIYIDEKKLQFLRHGIVV